MFAIKDKTLKLFNILEIFFQIFVGASFLLFCVFTLFAVFDNFHVDTFALTNYGFVILLGLSTICFAWSNNNQLVKDNETAKRLYLIAVEALYGAIVFLLGSALKYIVITTDKNQSLALFLIEFPKAIFIPKAAAMLCQIKAIISFYNTVTGILRVIFSCEMNNHNTSNNQNASADSVAKISESDKL